MQLQESGEMYLETILILSQKKPSVRSVDVGEYMGFSKPSVSRAVGLLRQGGFLVMKPDGALLLTDVGRAVRAAYAAGCRRENRGRGRVPHGTRDQRQYLPGDPCTHGRRGQRQALRRYGGAQDA